jgi:hypothetical protein
MKSVLHACVLAALAVIASGCAEMQWTKPGADAAALARDQNECRAIALQRAAPVAARGALDARTDAGRPPVMAPAQGSNERFVAEHEEMRRCMIQRGYALKPAS